MDYKVNPDALPLTYHVTTGYWCRACGKAGSGFGNCQNCNAYDWPLILDHTGSPPPNPHPDCFA